MLTSKSRKIQKDIDNIRFGLEYSKSSVEGLKIAVIWLDNIAFCYPETEQMVNETKERILKAFKK